MKADYVHNPLIRQVRKKTLARRENWLNDTVAHPGRQRSIISKSFIVFASSVDTIEPQLNHS